MAWEAWQEASDTWQIYVKRWDGTAWVEVGVGSASGGGVSDTEDKSENPSLGQSWLPSLVLDATGHAVVAWMDEGDTTSENDDNDAWQIYVKRQP